MRVPRRSWQLLIRDDPLREGADSRLSEMIYFGKADVTYKVSDPSFANFHQRRSDFVVATGLCQFSSKKIQLLDGKTCHYAKDYGLVQEEGLFVSSWFGLLPWKQIRQLVCLWSNDSVVRKTTLM